MHPSVFQACPHSILTICRPEYFMYLMRIHWNGNVAILTQFESLKTDKMSTFKWRYLGVHYNIRPHPKSEPFLSCCGSFNFVSYCEYKRDPSDCTHDDVIKWKQFPRNWPFVRRILRSPVNSPHKGQWHGALMFSLIYSWINSWVHNREVGDLRRHRAHYEVIVMQATVFHVLNSYLVESAFLLCSWNLMKMSRLRLCCTFLGN